MIAPVNQIVKHGHWSRISCCPQQLQKFIKQTNFHHSSCNISALKDFSRRVQYHQLFYYNTEIFSSVTFKFSCIPSSYDLSFSRNVITFIFNASVKLIKVSNYLALIFVQNLVCGTISSSFCFKQNQFNSTMTFKAHIDYYTDYSV